jgi:hypothetical protein
VNRPSGGHRQQHGCWLTAASVVALFVVSMLGLFGTVHVAESLGSPEDACNDALPWFEGFVITSARREWPPPLIRCTFVDTDPGQTTNHGSVSALSSKYLVVVAFLDLASAVGIALGIMTGIRAPAPKQRGQAEAHT